MMACFGDKRAIGGRMRKILRDFFFISKEDKIPRIRYFCYFMFLSLVILSIAFIGATSDRRSTLFITFFVLVISVSLYVHFNITAKRIRDIGFRYAYALSCAISLLIPLRWFFSEYSIVRTIFLILTIWPIIIPSKNNKA